MKQKSPLGKTLSGRIAMGERLCLFPRGLPLITSGAAIGKEVTSFTDIIVPFIRN